MSRVRLTRIVILTNFGSIGRNLGNIFQYCALLMALFCGFLMALVCNEMDTAKLFERSSSSFCAKI